MKDWGGDRDMATSCGSQEEDTRTDGSVQHPVCPRQNYIPQIHFHATDISWQSRDSLSQYAGVKVDVLCCNRIFHLSHAPHADRPARTGCVGSTALHSSVSPKQVLPLLLWETVPQHSHPKSPAYIDRRLHGSKPCRRAYEH